MTKEEKYIASIREIEIRLEKGGDLIGDLGNIAAILKKRFDFYWVGFYFLKGERLVLGPFQGTPACVFLPFGQGVCGTCVQKKRTVIVPNVRLFSGHIECDPNSESEIAVPLVDLTNKTRGVLDVDSTEMNNFDEVDKNYLEKIGESIRPLW